MIANEKKVEAYKILEIADDNKITELEELRERNKDKFIKEIEKARRKVWAKWHPDNTSRFAKELMERFIKFRLEETGCNLPDCCEKNALTKKINPCSDECRLAYEKFMGHWEKIDQAYEIIMGNKVEEKAEEIIFAKNNIIETDSNKPLWKRKDELIAWIYRWLDEINEAKNVGESENHKRGEFIKLKKDFENFFKPEWQREIRGKKANFTQANYENLDDYVLHLNKNNFEVAGSHLAQKIMTFWIKENWNRYGTYWEEKKIGDFFSFKKISELKVESWRRLTDTMKKIVEYSQFSPADRFNITMLFQINKHNLSRLEDEVDWEHILEDLIAVNKKLCRKDNSHYNRYQATKNSIEDAKRRQKIRLHRLKDQKAKKEFLLQRGFKPEETACWHKEDLTKLKKWYEERGDNDKESELIELEEWYKVEEEKIKQKFKAEVIEIKNHSEFPVSLENFLHLQEKEKSVSENVFNDFSFIKDFLAKRERERVVGGISAYHGDKNEETEHQFKAVLDDLVDMYELTADQKYDALLFRIRDQRWERRDDTEIKWGADTEYEMIELINEVVKLNGSQLTNDRSKQKLNSELNKMGGERKKLFFKTGVAKKLITDYQNAPLLLTSGEEYIDQKKIDVKELAISFEEEFNIEFGLEDQSLLEQTIQEVVGACQVKLIEWNGETGDSEISSQVVKKNLKRNLVQTKEISPRWDVLTKSAYSQQETYNLLAKNIFNIAKLSSQTVDSLIRQENEKRENWRNFFTEEEKKQIVDSAEERRINFELSEREWQNHLSQERELIAKLINKDYQLVEEIRKLLSKMEIATSQDKRFLEEFNYQMPTEIRKYMAILDEIEQIESVFSTDILVDKSRLVLENEILNEFSAKVEQLKEKNNAYAKEARKALKILKGISKEGRQAYKIPKKDKGLLVPEPIKHDKVYQSLIQGNQETINKQQGWPEKNTESETVIKGSTNTPAKPSRLGEIITSQSRFSDPDIGWLTDDNLNYILGNHEIIQQALNSQNQNDRKWKVRTDLANIYHCFYKAKNKQEWGIAEFLQELELDKTKYTIFPLRVSGNHWGMFILENDGGNKRVYYTSSGGGVEREVEQIKPLIEQVMGKEVVENMLIIEPISKQNNGYDCGVYLVFYIQELLATGKLELKNSITEEKCQQFRQKWKEKIGDKWCWLDNLGEQDIKGNDRELLYLVSKKKDVPLIFEQPSTKELINTGTQTEPIQEQGGKEKETSDSSQIIFREVNHHLIWEGIVKIRKILNHPYINKLEKSELKLRKDEKLAEGKKEILDEIARLIASELSVNQSIKTLSRLIKEHDDLVTIESYLQNLRTDRVIDENVLQNYKILGERTAKYENYFLNNPIKRTENQAARKNEKVDFWWQAALNESNQQKVKDLENKSENHNPDNETIQTDEKEESLIKKNPPLAKKLPWLKKLLNFEKNETEEKNFNSLSRDTTELVKREVLAELNDADFIWTFYHNSLLEKLFHETKISSAKREIYQKLKLLKKYHDFRSAGGPAGSVTNEEIEKFMGKYEIKRTILNTFNPTQYGIGYNYMAQHATEIVVDQGVNEEKSQESTYSNVKTQVGSSPTEEQFEAEEKWKAEDQEKLKESTKQKEFDKLKNEIDELNRKLEEKNREIKNFQVKINDGEETSQNLQNELNLLKEQTTRLLLQFNHLHSQYNREKSERKRYEWELMDSNWELNSLATKLNQAEEKYSNLQNQLNQSQQRLQEVEQQVENLTNENNVNSLADYLFKQLKQAIKNPLKTTALITAFLGTYKIGYRQGLNSVNSSISSPVSDLVITNNTFTENTCPFYPYTENWISFPNSKLIELRQDYTNCRAELSNLTNEISKFPNITKEEYENLLVKRDNLNTTVEDYHKLQSQIINLQNTPKQTFPETQLINEKKITERKNITLPAQTIVEEVVFPVQTQNNTNTEPLSPETSFENYTENQQIGTLPQETETQIVKEIEPAITLTLTPNTGIVSQTEMVTEILPMETKTTTHNSATTETSTQNITLPVQALTETEIAPSQTANITSNETFSSEILTQVATETSPTITEKSTETSRLTTMVNETIENQEKILTEKEKAKVADKKKSDVYQKTQKEKDACRARQNQILEELTIEQTNRSQTQQSLAGKVTQLNQTEMELATAQAEKEEHNQILLKELESILKNQPKQTSKLNYQLTGWVEDLEKYWKKQNASLEEQLRNEKQAHQQTTNERDNSYQERDNYRTQAEQAKTQLNNHVCPTINQVNCSHADYEVIKTERSILATQLAAVLNEKSAIIQQINTSLNLGLNQPSLEQVITRIQELINKPPQTIYQELNNNELKQAQETITKLKKELKEIPFGEDLAKIKEIDLKGIKKELNIQLSPQAIQHLEQATTYQQFSTARNAEIKKHLQQDLNNLAAVNQPKEIVAQSINKERMVWLGLLLTALLTIGGLLIKIKIKKKEI
ncbi:Ulp1 family isopeptidase [endosymbiont GvMRE of Glomus versiforme]|uniref:Ulp1 family isopeptidase n=1 Tax=endosymbiont GvMRE of Glomus versiforme TaxID=2039283 RepID=UPI000EE57525|nr:Ulp1 family isopeptidase [endosymbiont GvMRE of Glomus versiforme]RHZ36143.1 hypothetical protein GvMRE_Ic2g120 [endosymbiont GvMRE of Glomus versiforme]